MYKKIKVFSLRNDSQGKRGFSLIELVVVIAIIGVLVMLATPNFMGYVEKAELARIKHDVKIMEDKMAEDSINGVKDFKDWDDNAKDLSLLVLADLLYETKGKAKNVAKPRTRYGDVASSGDTLSEVEVSSDYKIMPEVMSKRIKTNLPGTFYTNADGKVYYEHEKPLTRANVSISTDCIAPNPKEGGYIFDHKEGKITGYTGTEFHLVIPASFKVGDKCYPVRVIGRGAFMRGFERVIVPEGVVEIEDEAFDSEVPDIIKEIIFPSSLKEIRDEIFSTNIRVDNIIINNSSSNVSTGSKVNSGAIGDSSGPVFSGGYKSSGNFSIGSSGNASLSIQGNSGSSGGSGTGSSGNASSTVSKISYDVISSSTSSSGKGIKVKEQTPSKEGIIVIPEAIEVAGKEIPVVEIEKSAFQGEGLISVILPSGLERIEDYAFAGNQLVAVHIPESVKYIGSYAFSFNELTDGKSYRPTIQSIKILSDSGQNRINNLGKHGDIEKDGKRLTRIGQTEFLNQVFVNSRDNYVINIDNSNKNSIKEPVAVISGLPTGALITSQTKINWSSANSKTFNGRKIVEEKWTNKKQTYPTGEHVIKLQVKDEMGYWSESTELRFLVKQLIESSRKHSHLSVGPLYKEEGTDYFLTDREGPLNIKLTGYDFLYSNGYGGGGPASGYLEMYDKNNRLLSKRPFSGGTLNLSLSANVKRIRVYGVINSSMVLRQARANIEII